MEARRKMKPQTSAAFIASRRKSAFAAKKTARPRLDTERAPVFHIAVFYLSSARKSTPFSDKNVFSSARMPAATCTV